jgi:N-acetylmuramoyl-L-alanine amidase
MDAGAIGPRGTLEKNINLDVAKALAKQLKKEKNVQVIMTRENDDFVPLNERTDIANAAGADLFVSIHCNSSLSAKNLGFETYFLAPEATDKAAEAVARLENSVVALEAKKGAASSKLESLLASMAVHDQINESSHFASMIVRSVKQVSGQDKASVKEADFFVLRGAQMPAVLVELEYLSHPVSEVKLRSSRFRNHMISGLVDGILSFDKQLRREKENMAVQINPPTNKTNR